MARVQQLALSFVLYTSCVLSVHLICQNFPSELIV